MLMQGVLWIVPRSRLTCRCPAPIDHGTHAAGPARQGRAAPGGLSLDAAAGYHDTLPLRRQGACRPAQRRAIVSVLAHTFVAPSPAICSITTAVWSRCKSCWGMRASKQRRAMIGAGSGPRRKPWARCTFHTDDRRRKA